MLAHTDNLARTLPDDLSLRKIFGLLKLPYAKLDTARVRQSGGVWPEPLGAQARSSLCPTEQWTLDAAPDGTSATLRFSRPDNWKELRGPNQLTTVTADAQLIVQTSLLGESTPSLP